MKHKLTPMPATVFPELSDTDEQLAARARLGSRDSFDQLARRFQVRLLRFIQRQVRNDNDAEDILQDTFVRAFERLDSYDERRPFGTWLFTLAHRMAVSHHRHKLAGLRASEVLAHRSRGMSSVDPGTLVAELDGRDHFWHIAATVLTEEQLCAVWLFYVEKMPARQIGQVLDRSWVSMKTLLFRARRILAVALAPDVSASTRPAKTLAATHRLAIAPGT